MEITTKYQNGQKVFFLNNDHRCECASVECINVFCHADGKVSVSYNVGTAIAMDEDRLFPSEAALKSYVFGEVKDQLIDFS